MRESVNMHVHGVFGGLLVRHPRTEKRITKEKKNKATDFTKKTKKHEE